MLSFGNLLQSVLLVLVFSTVARSQVEKLATCCTKVTSVEITEPITGYLVQQASKPCVTAVIFQTQSGLYCAQLKAPWVKRKILAFKAAKAQATAPSSTLSLLSLITSTASPDSSSFLPPSSSFLPPSSPSTSEIPESADE